jgi:hypothetical protein
MANKHCPELETIDLALGDDLIAAGIDLPDFDAPDFKRVRRDAEVQLHSQFDRNPAAFCAGLWKTFGAGGSYGRQMVKRR